MNFVYILRCSDGSYYTGWTKDLENRISRHNEKKGAKYTRGRLPVILVYYEEYEEEGTARKREIAIKKLKRSQKESLIRSQHGCSDLY